MIVNLFIATIYQNVPSDMRPYIHGSPSNFTINDLLNITQLSGPVRETSNKSSNNPIHLLIQWYFEENARRRLEMVHVLHMNVINAAISNIHFIQNSKNCTVWNDIRDDPHFPMDLFQSKLILFYQDDTNVNQRLTMGQAFQYANRGITTGYAILTNVDIFFDHSLSLLQHRSLLDRYTVLYLSRYEVDPLISTLGLQCSHEHYVGSHDAIIFQPPFPRRVIDQLPFEIGTWHVEVKIIYELIKAQYIVRNPCESIRIWHLHSSQVRHRMMPSKKYIPNYLLDFVMRRPEVL